MDIAVPAVRENKSTRTLVHGAAMLGCGALLGVSLSRIGFTSYEEVQRMFHLQDIRMILVFALGVVLTGVALRLMPAARTLPPRSFHRGIIPGSALFGLGWAVTGACPGAMFAMVGEGQAFAIVSLLGAAAGVKIADYVNVRWIHADSGSC